MLERLDFAEITATELVKILSSMADDADQSEESAHELALAMAQETNPSEKMVIEHSDLIEDAQALTRSIMRVLVRVHSESPWEA